MNISDLFGGVQFGRETSGKFRLTLDVSRGTAVKVDDRYVASDGSRLTDVTPLALQGTDNLFVRIPAKTLEKGDLVVTSDNPFRALFVNRVENDSVIGLDPWTRQQVTFVGFDVPMLKETLFVKVVGLDEAMNIDEEFQPLLPALFAGDTGEHDSVLLALALSGSQRPDASAWLPLLLSRSSGDWGAVAALLASRSEQKPGRRPAAAGASDRTELARVKAAAKKAQAEIKEQAKEMQAEMREQARKMQAETANEMAKIKEMMAAAVLGRPRDPIKRRPNGPHGKG